MKFISAFLIFSSFLPVYAKDLVDKVVASVNNEIILLSDLQNIPSRLKKQGGLDESLLLGVLPESLKGNRPEQLNYLIRERLVESEIKRLSMTATDEQLDAQLNQMAKKNRMSLSEFSIYLGNQGYTLQEYRENLKSRFERQSFFEREIINKLRITDDDAYGVFQAKNPNSKSTVGEFQIAQIFFSIKKGGVPEALARAKSVYEKLLEGESFESLAGRFDETPGSNKNGVLGVFKAGEFLPSIEKAISTLSVNSTSEILRGPNGFHIVKLLEKKMVPDPLFAKAKEGIKAALVQQNFERQLKNWFELKKSAAHIKIYDETL